MTSVLALGAQMTIQNPRLVTIDWIIIWAYIVVSILIAVVVSKRGRKSSDEYFKSGGGVTWWLLGTSIVATTFAADTPLALAGMVVTQGISLNWFWWCQVPITMAGVFFFANLWKRANPLTDMEFVYTRYSGKPASALRGFKALYLALPYNCLVMGWVNKAMATIIQLCVPDFPSLGGIDKLMLALFMATPLSQSIHPEVAKAVERGDIKPLEIVEHYKLMNYQNIQLFREVEQGVYDKDRELAFARMGISENLKPGKLDGVYGVPERLYVKSEEEAAAERLKAWTSMKALVAQAGLRRPVNLPDGSVIEYEDIPNSYNRIEKIGKDQLAAAAKEGKATGAPLAEMTKLEFFQNIYNISAGVNQYKILFILFLITVGYTAISGLWGVLITDFFQFILAMSGCIVLAVISVRACGGMDEMFTRMAGIYSLDKARAMVSITPTGAAGGLGLMPINEFLIYILLVWWCVGFTDGGSYIAQRLLSAKDERHAALGYLWYGICHYTLRMWPWLVVGFAAAVLSPHLPYPNGHLPTKAMAEEGYIRVMLGTLGPGLLGLMVAAFLAAYMSTIATQVNNGASYLMNDFYRPFLRPNQTERHYVRVSMWATLVIAVAGISVSLMLNSIQDAWFLLSSFNAGIGIIYLLRWYWWRISAWTEIVCLGCLLFMAAVLKWIELKYGVAVKFPYNLLIAMPFSVGFALLITLFTAPTDRKKLHEFCRKVQPGGPGWAPVEAEIRAIEPAFRQNSPLNWNNFRRWMIAITTIYCFLFGIGKVIIGDTLYPDALIPNRLVGVGLLAVGAFLGWGIARSFGEKRWSG